MGRKLDPKSRSGFIRAQPTTMSVADVIAKAKAEGHEFDERLVYTVRARMNMAANTRSVNRRGPGRPRKDNAPVPAGGASVGSGLVAEIERIVEKKVTEMLKAKLGTLFRS